MVPTNHPTLLEQLTVRFNEEELRNLCMELDIDVESFQSQKKSGLARGLIDHCQRHGSMEQLLGRLNVLRPHVNWSAPHLAAVSKLAVGSSLLELAKTPTLAIGFQKDFEAAQSKIEDIAYYKQLHDYLQEIETSYDAIKYNFMEQLANDTAAWNGIIAQEFFIQRDISELLRVAQNRPSIIKAWWLTLLEQGQETLKQAILHKDVAKLEEAFRFLARALDRGLPRVNGRLVDAAIDLPLDNLIRALEDVHQMLHEQSQQEQAIFAQDIQRLHTLETDLEEIVHVHNRWQELDNELRRVDVLLENDFEELRVSWPDIKDIISLIPTAEHDFTLQKMQDLSDQIDAALHQKPPPVSTRAYFQSYRSIAARRFRRIDDQLLDHCRTLETIGSNLNFLLSKLQ